MEVRKISRGCPRSVNDTELSHFTLLFCRALRRNVQRFITHEHSYCFVYKGNSIPSDRQFSSNFRERTDPNEISNVKQISLKNWERNGGFKFWPEVKITRLIGIFSAVFSNQFFSLEADTVKS